MAMWYKNYPMESIIIYYSLLYCIVAWFPVFLIHNPEIAYYIYKDGTHLDHRTPTWIGAGVYVILCFLDTWCFNGGRLVKMMFHFFFLVHIIWFSYAGEGSLEAANIFLLLGWMIQFYHWTTKG